MGGKWREKSYGEGDKQGELLVLHFRNDKQGKGSEKRTASSSLGCKSESFKRYQRRDCCSYPLNHQVPQRGLTSTRMM